MIKSISGVLLAIVISNIPSTTSYEANLDPIVIEEKTVWTEQELFLYAEKYAEKHNVSKDKMIEVIDCEAPWSMINGVKSYSLNNTQSKHKYNEGQIQRNPSWGAVGDYERSFGPVQIHEPAHPEITREQANDPDFAINYLASEIAAGRGNKWSCY